MDCVVLCQTSIELEAEEEVSVTEVEWQEILLHPVLLQAKEHQAQDMVFQKFIIPIPELETKEQRIVQECYHQMLFQELDGISSTDLKAMFQDSRKRTTENWRYELNLIITR